MRLHGIDTDTETLLLHAMRLLSTSTECHLNQILYRAFMDRFSFSAALARLNSDHVPVRILSSTQMFSRFRVN